MRSASTRMDQQRIGRHWKQQSRQLSRSLPLQPLQTAPCHLLAIQHECRCPTSLLLAPHFWHSTFSAMHVSHNVPPWALRGGGPDLFRATMRRASRTIHASVMRQRFEGPGLACLCGTHCGSLSSIHVPLQCHGVGPCIASGVGQVSESVAAWCRPEGGCHQLCSGSAGVAYGRQH